MTACRIAPTLAALALLAAAPAWAQSSPPTSGGANSTPPSSTTPMTGAPPSGGTASPHVGAPAARAPGSASDMSSRSTTDQKPWRASKLIGADVYGADNRKIGDVDDLLVSESGDLTAVLSVGGFLGIGNKLVSVPYSELKHGEHWMLPGANEESLKGRPEFRYADSRSD
ncbi:MAG TPA: PRC-barrel domain-containing protein [Roseomonas sp.]|nr:PRC-barrel domain-containing protein [Roseomonas sp.]